MDIGIFPWFKSIDVSLLFSGDECDRYDVATWPEFDYSKFNEGGWQQARPIADQFAREWEAGMDIIDLLKRESLVVQSDSVKRTLDEFRLAQNFTIQILNSDDGDSPNYCA